MSNWRNEKFQVPSCGDFWDAFAQRYPEVFKQVERIADRAGTWDADAKVIEAAAALLADYHDWMIRAKLAMFGRKAIAFDGLCRESEQITQDLVKFAPLQCLECGAAGPPHPIDADHSGWLCPECYSKAKVV